MARTAVALAAEIRVVATAVDAVTADMAVRVRPGMAAPSSAAAAALLTTPCLVRVVDAVLRRAMDDSRRPTKKANEPPGPGPFPDAAVPQV